MCYFERLCLNVVPPAITGTLEEMNKSCETCIHDKDVAGILFTLSHHFYGDLLIPGKGIAVHLLRDSGLFSVYRCWVPVNDCVSLFELAARELSYKL